MGVTSRRSVYVWQEPDALAHVKRGNVEVLEPRAGALHYESFDYGSARAKQTPSTAISGGTSLKTADGRVTYSFQKNGITYRVITNSQPSSASISVLKGNRLLQTEIPRGYADVRDK